MKRLVVILLTLNSTTLPTIQSLREAVARYQLHGGYANIIIGDDGLQLIDVYEREYGHATQTIRPDFN